jgi:hypothetical protein
MIALTVMSTTTTTTPGVAKTTELTATRMRARTGTAVAWCCETTGHDDQVRPTFFFFVFYLTFCLPQDAAAVPNTTEGETDNDDDVANANDIWPRNHHGRGCNGAPYFSFFSLVLILCAQRQPTTKTTLVLPMAVIPPQAATKMVRVPSIFFFISFFTFGMAT